MRRDPEFCFIDVRDVVGALVRLADGDDAIGEVVNIGSRNGFSIQQVADLVTSTTRTALPGNLLAGPILCAPSRSAAGGRCHSRDASTVDRTDDAK